MGSNSGWDVDWDRPPTTDENNGGTTTPPPVNNEPQWYTPTNVYLPPGVDPYYGVSITGINGSSGGGTTSPIDQGGIGGSKEGRMTGTDSAGTDTGYQNYLSRSGGILMDGGFYMPNAHNLSYEDYKKQYNKESNSSNTLSNSGDFKIARPNMTWHNNLPTVVPANGQAALNAYAPLPFTREANTPGVNYVKPQLTYNNPYNTNPYLPTANPFALIANTPTSGS